MTSDRDDDTEKQSFEGVRIELPFISFHAGRGRMGWFAEMNEDDAYERARRRVRARLGFYRHLTTFAAVIAAVVFIDLVTGGGLSGFTRWFAAIWGVFIIWQALNVFVFPSIWSRETEEKMIQDELRRQGH